MDDDTRAVMRLSDANEENVVPADVLARTLSALQQLVYIVASDEEHRTMEHRFRLTSEIEEGYKLLCSIPKAGSYAVPLMLAPLPFKQLKVGEEPIFSRVHELLQNLAVGDMQSAERTFKDRGLAKRSLQEVRRLLPKSDDSWFFGFQSGSKATEVKLRKESIRRIDHYLTRKAVPEESITTITGELVAIAFDERKLSLRYPPTSQEIECIYEEDAEDEMLENRRQFVQVTGKFTLDKDGHPTKLTECTLIEPLDLSPIILNDVTYEERRFRFGTKKIFEVRQEPEEKQYLIVEDPKLEMLVYGRTRDDLIDEIGAHIGHLWIEYAQCDDEELTPQAVVLKLTLLNTVELVNGDH
jgi:hypothetical protein